MISEISLNYRMCGSDYHKDHPKLQDSHPREVSNGLFIV